MRIDAIVTKHKQFVRFSRVMIFAALVTLPIITAAQEQEDEVTPQDPNADVQQCAQNPASVPEDNAANIKDELSACLQESGSVATEIRSIQREVEKLRLDQINYRLEKNILKEAYSSSIETINTVITIVLAVLAVLGFIGIKSIRDLKSQFSSEFAKLQNLRARYQAQLREIRSSQKLAEARMQELADVNSLQDNRLRILEIQEKAGALVISRDFRRALEYIAIGIDIDPDDSVLLHQKAACHWNLSEFREAIVVLKKLLNLEPDSPSVVENLAEMHLLVMDYESFDALLADYHGVLERYAGGPWLAVYLMAAREFTAGNVQGIRDIIETNIRCENPVKRHTEDNWEFVQILTALRSQPDTAQKRLMLALISYLQGEQTEAELLEAAGNLPPE